MKKIIPASIFIFIFIHPNGRNNEAVVHPIAGFVYCNARCHLQAPD